jgi:hypothetical protein
MSHLAPCAASSDGKHEWVLRAATLGLALGHHHDQALLVCVRCKHTGIVAVDWIGERTSLPHGPQLVQADRRLGAVGGE